MLRLRAMGKKYRTKRKRLGIRVGKIQVLPSRDRRKRRREGQQEREEWKTAFCGSSVETWELIVEGKDMFLKGAVGMARRIKNVDKMVENFKHVFCIH